MSNLSTDPERQGFWVSFLSSLFVFLQSTEKFMTTSAYKAELDDEMSFELGVIVTVLEKNFDGWWLVRWV